MRGNTGSEECRGCAIDGAISTTLDLVQTAKSQSPSRQNPVNRGHSERQNRTDARISTFETRNAFSKLGNGSRGRRYTHLTLETRKACDMFYICSSWLRVNRDDVVPLRKEAFDARAISFNAKNVSSIFGVWAPRSVRKL